MAQLYDFNAVMLTHQHYSFMKLNINNILLNTGGY